MPEHLYDAIHVGAYCKEIPSPLLQQLKPGGNKTTHLGKMFVPAGNPQQILFIEKDKFGRVTIKPGFPVVYVPLTDKRKQLY